MKKRIVTLLLGLVLILSLTVPALAVCRIGVYIMDETDYLTQSEFQFLQTQAMELSEGLDMDILYVLTNDWQLQPSDNSLTLGRREDRIMLLANDEGCTLHLFGSALALTEEDTKRLLDAYTEETDHINGAIAYLAAAEEIVTERNRTDPFESWAAEYGGEMPRVVDQADLLNPAEQTVFLQRLDEISQRQQLDIVVVTVDSLDGKTAMDYADDFYDQYGYGFGANYDGILLLVSIEQRDWWISTTGYGITAFTDAGLEYISDRFVPKLSQGQYAKAFEIFAEKCDDFITQARTGEPYDVGNMPTEPFRFGLCLFISAAIGLFAAGCVVWKLKGQLVTVHVQPEANRYFLFGAPQLSTNKEIYLYSTMTSRPKLKLEDFSDGSSGSSRGGGFGGGSRIHISSSGRFHGGRGGKF